MHVLISINTAIPIIENRNTNCAGSALDLETVDTVDLLTMDIEDDCLC